MPFVGIIMGRHHTEIRRFRIFALVLGEEVYVGKTTSPRISAVYSRHRCGTVAATRGILDQEERPSLHILQQLECTGADAYRHVLAWLHLFAQSGFCSLNHETTAASSDLLYPPTEAIRKSLPQGPVDQILARTCVEKPVQADWKQEKGLQMFSGKEKQVQMNLRMTAGDKKTFDRFCRKNRLKSREALGLMLDQITGEDTHLKQLLSVQKALREENSRLKDRLAVKSGKEASAQEKRCEAYLHFLLPGLTDYIRQLFPNEEEDSLPSVPYKRFRKQTEIRYEYPSQEGFYVLTAEMLLWGRNRARFVAGRGEKGEALKFRYYPKPLYAGVPIWEYPSGTRWLVGCRQAADGAMEIAAAFPLPPVPEKPVEEAVFTEPERKLSLQDQIQKAEEKR